jgi:hypothetical protein
VTRYLAERPTITEADALFIDQSIDYFRACRANRGPEYARMRTANLIQDHLTDLQTGMRRPTLGFGSRALRQHWDEVAESHTDTANDIATLMRDGNWQDARCALAATLDAIEPF